MEKKDKIIKYENNIHSHLINRDERNIYLNRLDDNKYFSKS